MADSDKGKKAGIAVKIIIPVIIAAIVVAIAVAKNSGEEPAAQSAPAAQVEQSAGQTEDGNADFELLTTEIDMDKLKTYGIPILIDFGADECVPCREMAPVLAKLNEEWKGRVIVKFVDVWKYPELADDFPISLIPTQLFFDAEGNPFVPSEALMDEILFNLYSLKDTKEHVFTSHEGGLNEKQIKAIFYEMGVAE